MRMGGGGRRGAAARGAKFFRRVTADVRPVSLPTITFGGGTKRIHVQRG
jgi:hypothetical protein